MYYMGKRLTALLTLLAALCPQVQADQLILKNGDRITGKIVRSDGKTLVIRTDFAGDVTVLWGAIDKISSDAPLYLTLADGRTVSGLVSMEGERIEVASASAPAVTTERASLKVVRSEEEQKAFDRLQRPGWLDLWSGSASLGFTLTSGNSENTNITMGLALERKTLRDKTNFYAASLYAKDRAEEETTASTARGGLRYERNITPKWFGYAFTNVESDQKQDLNLRVVLGGGLGYRPIDSERIDFDILGGADWNKEYFEGDLENRSSAEIHVGQSLAWRLGSPLTLKEQFFFYPNLSEWGENRMNFDVTLNTAITRRIGWQLTLSDRYLSNPPPGIEKNDLLLTTGLSLKIGGPGK
ncbi:MAG TPA: DUF481 domain-containing protein [Blastocatellia bacterium]|nr:DUF481 domain-containing protein [Blastocatellia bacterium]